MKDVLGQTIALPRAAGAFPPAAAGVLLQRVLFDRPSSLRSLYVKSAGLRTAARPVLEAGELHLPARIPVSFDTYFNALFECQWRSSTRLRGLVLDLEARGDVALRVVRRLPETGDVTLVERRLQGLDGPVSIVLPPAPAHPRATGRLYLELTALRPGSVLRSAAWRSADTPTEAVGLVLVFCTFNRELELARVLASLAADAQALDAVTRIVVVNQGRPGLASHAAFAALPAMFGRRLDVLEQSNFGGVGGFTRGMLAAQDTPGATHVLLMDDDVVAEPESLRRVGAFFAIARPGVALGGHMLDLLQPTRLYKAGARIAPGSWALEPLHFHLPVERSAGLDRLQGRQPMHYNGWWMFGLPLPMLEQVGLPLPCFIRGDDVEYGRRLHDRGLFTVSLPGVAVWHEPFYLRLGGWQLYYETRNMLITAALHFPRRGPGLAVLVLKRLLGQLLTYRYYSAALILRAVADYLRGPALLEQAPWALHAALDEEKSRFPPATMPGERVAPWAPQLADPRGRARFLARLVRAVTRNLRGRAPAGDPVRVRIADLLWFRVLNHDRIVAETGWEANPPLFERDPAAFRQLLAEGLYLAARLARRAAPVQAAWRDALPRFASREFWHGYLGLPPIIANDDAARPPSAETGSGELGACIRRRA